jgi:hypothetical protein
MAYEGAADSLSLCLRQYRKRTQYLDVDEALSRVQQTSCEEDMADGAVLIVDRDERDPRLHRQRAAEVLN